MKILLTLLFGISLTSSAMASPADVVIGDGSQFLAIAADVNDDAVFELDQMNSRGWHHVGCVSQVNSSSICRRKAAQYGYSQSRIQQDYLCPPKTFYSCYGSGTGASEVLSDPNFQEALSSSAGTESYNSCSAYVKPAACVSHSECKWVGSCVPRKR